MILKAEPTSAEITVAATTQADIDALNDAIAAGVRQVTIGGQTVTYNTTESLIKARDDAQRLFNKQTTPSERRSRRTMMYHAGRGF